MWTRRIAVALALALVAAPARAQHKGSGSGQAPATTAPVTKTVGPSVERAELPARDLPIEPRHGLLGAPGAARDAAGPSRLGPHADRATLPSYGEAAQQGSGGGTTHETWKSGDRIRSWTSADVRAARGQQAPDLEWASAGGGSSNAQAQPQEPYGKRFQKEQRRAKR
ncbi:MAG TPA: hypothetical protein VF904_15125 [Anaeromyxobacteraceae bacterium]